MAEINGGTGTAGDQGGFPGERTQEYYVVDAMTIVLSSPSVQIPRQSDWAKCPKLRKHGVEASEVGGLISWFGTPNQDCAGYTDRGAGPPPAAVPALSTVVGVQRPTAIAETANAGNATWPCLCIVPRERASKETSHEAADTNTTRRLELTPYSASKPIHSYTDSSILINGKILLVQ
ncbi:hypothetical protein CISG_06592 [Coccidioides immitis RMSCC 3703]|uniref:Uncharacterized protein n=1 Tax=Coccidioides immitis RMSCC 3703 TaxID=454286 RepID=A0A0J8R0U7_COCIT|nr:hypothetical protein CISG_06592 [Coccidioides immitis RMSCC 3703]